MRPLDYWVVAIWVNKVMMAVWTGCHMGIAGRDGGRLNSF